MGTGRVGTGAGLNGGQTRPRAAVETEAEAAGSQASAYEQWDVCISGSGPWIWELATRCPAHPWSLSVVVKVGFVVSHL